MVEIANIRPGQIDRARKLIQELPIREERKTKAEAAELLEADFKKAKEKGYGPKELSQILKNEGIIIPAYLIKKHFSERKADGNVAQSENNQSSETEATTSSTSKHLDLTDDDEL